MSLSVLGSLLAFGMGVYVGFTVGWMVFTRDDHAEEWTPFSQWEIDQLKAAREKRGRDIGA